MAIPILKNWKNYFTNRDEGLGSSYERIVLNQKLESICHHFKVETILEAPCFGFTGLSGINSAHLARKGCKVSLLDDNKERISMIIDLWEELKIPLEITFSPKFNKIPFEDKSFDFSWNFSALWFVEDLEIFLEELTRATSKVILLCVPNRTGLGYTIQKKIGKEDLKTYLREKNIYPKNIKKIMMNLDWLLIDNKYIDCPPWPDIGMPKEKFLKIFGLSELAGKQRKEPLSIMDYYSGKTPDFPDKMMKYYWFEKNIPAFIKMFWAHHKYFLFIPKGKNEK